MVRQTSRLGRARIVFLVVFLISTCVAALSLASIPQSVEEEPPASEPGSPGPSPGSPPAGVAEVNVLSVITAVASSVTSVFTFLGLISTTVLKWRKEARKRADHELERQYKEIEIEKHRLELEALRAERDERLRRVVDGNP